MSEPRIAPRYELLLAPTPDVVFDVQRAHAWLASDGASGATVADDLGVSDGSFSYGDVDWSSQLEGLISAATTAGMFGGLQVVWWPTYDHKHRGPDGGLVTVDLPGTSLRLTGLHCRHRDLIDDREASGVAAAVAVLAAVAAETRSILAPWRWLTAQQ